MSTAMNSIAALKTETVAGVHWVLAARLSGTEDILQVQSSSCPDIVVGTLELLVTLSRTKHRPDAARLPVRRNARSKTVVAQRNIGEKGYHRLNSGESRTPKIQPSRRT